VDIYCDSHDVPPDAITLDIDDTFDTAHGQQQLIPTRLQFDSPIFDFPF
jgi:hypothetical protein